MKSKILLLSVLPILLAGCTYTRENTLSAILEEKYNNKNCEVYNLQTISDKPEIYQAAARFYNEFEEFNVMYDRENTTLYDNYAKLLFDKDIRKEVYEALKDIDYKADIIHAMTNESFKDFNYFNYMQCTDSYVYLDINEDNPDLVYNALRSIDDLGFRYIAYVQSGNLHKTYSNIEEDPLTYEELIEDMSR